jgi:hypothetical protein
MLYCKDPKGAVFNDQGPERRRVLCAADEGQPYGEEMFATQLFKRKPPAYFPQEEFFYSLGSFP